MSNSNKKTILIVDPDARFLSLIRKNLETEFNLTESSDGKSGFEAVMLSEFDLLISELNMPKLGGFALLKQVKETRPHLPVILMSAHFDENEQKEALNAGATAVLIKPFSRDLALETINGILNLTKPEEITESFHQIDQAKTSVDKWYAKISFENLILGTKAKWNLFLCVDGREVTKIVSKGDQIDLEKIKLYQHKGYEHVYLLKEDFEQYQAANLSILEKVSHGDSSRISLLTDLLHNVRDVMIDQFSFVEIDPNLFSTSKQEVIHAFTLIEADREPAELLLKVNLHTNWLFIHNLGVALFNVMIAKKIGLSGKDLSTIALGGILHDVGFVEIDPDSLNKARHKKTIKESQMMEAHPERGIEILEPFVNLNSDVRAIILEHHEDGNGTGFPRGLKKNKIHPMARITAVSDNFIFLGQKSPRSKEGMRPQEAVQRVVNLYQDKLDSQPLGSLMQIFGMTPKFFVEKWF